jgi:hypothetical protein
VFAREFNQVIQPTYLSFLKLDPDYHFPDNRPGAPGVFLIAHVKDGSGKVLKSLRIPDADANPWLRHRQEQIASRLNQDVPVPMPQGERLAPVGQSLPTVKYWDMVPDARNNFRLKEVSELEVPRGRPVFKPSDWSLLLAQSYARYLCRAYGGTAVEIERHTKGMIPPMALFEAAPQGALDETVYSFGELQP